MKKSIFSCLGLFLFACSSSAAVEDRAGDESHVDALASGCRQVDPMTRECTYKTVGSLPIKLDVHRAAGSEQRPAIMWIHGGALIFGNKSELPANQKDLFLKNGYVVVSIDYREAPETKLAEIVGDTVDAYQWMRRNASAIGIDPDRIAVMGGSAGGYLTLNAGVHFDPKPKALVSLYGYGDIRWYLTTGQAEQGCPANPFSAYPAGDPVAHTGEEVTQGAYTCNQNGQNGEDGQNGGNSQGGSGDEKRFEIYGCARAKGYWPQVVGGKHPDTDSAWFEQFEPNKRVDASYPPTILFHGKPDDDVPFSQAQKMDAALSAAHVEHQFVPNDKWQHMFDLDYCDPSVQCALRDAMTFLGAHLGVPTNDDALPACDPNATGSGQSRDGQNNGANNGSGNNDNWTQPLDDWNE